MSKRTLDRIKSIFGLFSLHRVRIARGMFKVVAAFTALVELFCALVYDTPTHPDGQELDMSRFSLVWSDEFDGDELDYDYWGGHYIWGKNSYYLRDTSYWCMDQVDVKNGNLILTTEYKEDGRAGAGYYATGIDTSPNHVFYETSTGYEQLYGYFEIRCILPKGTGINPAFWLLCEGMFDTDEGLTDGGVTGCEIDVFETKTNQQEDDKWYGSVFNTIHVDSYNEYHRSEMQGFFYADDPYNTYNTYGVEWNSKEYIFYINGVETAETDFGGVCTVPLYLIISVGVDENIASNMDLPSQMTVDYVRAYQYNDILQ